MPETRAAGDKRVLAVGDVMTDIIAKPEGPLVRGSDRRATIVARPGGSGANQAVWLAHFGVPVTFAGRVGARDAEGIGARLAKVGVTPRLAADAAHDSGMLVTLVDPDGERSFLTDRGANLALSAADLPDELLENVSLLAISGYSLFEPGPRAAVLDLMDRAKRKAVPIAVDPASASFLAELGPERFLEWTRGATMILPNSEEAHLLTGTVSESEQIAALCANYSVAVIKRGPLGAMAGAGPQRYEVAAHPVEVVDSTGAGDAFFAGFVASWLRGDPVPAALEAGVMAGALAVSRFGGQPPQ